MSSWERFVRRIAERERIKVYVSGSSSKMTPQELHTSLRGRAWSLEVLPFSFKEYLLSQGVSISNKESEFFPSGKHLLKRKLEEYLKWGGFPEVCQASTEIEKRKILREYLEAIFFRDLIERFRVSNITLIDTLRDKLFESTALKFSVAAFYNQYRNNFSFSKDSLYSYYKYFIQSLIVFETRKFSSSSYQRMRNPAKIYLVGNGIARRVTSEDRGRQLENMVFLELRRCKYQIFYFEEKRECDFIAQDDSGHLLPFQVSFELSNHNEAREFDGLIEACKSLKLTKGTMITFNEEREESVNGIKIDVVPAWKWFLADRGQSY